MELKQKKFSNQISFQFDDEMFHYYSKDKSGSEKFSVDYLDISFDAVRESIEKNAWYKMAGIFWIFLGAIQTIYGLKEEGTFKLSFWLVVGGISYALYMFNTVKYTILRCGQGNIYIIQGQGHDEILKELKARKNRKLKELYGVVDPANEPEKELEKFDWLLKHEVISQDEYNEAKKNILSRRNEGGFNNLN